MSGYSGHVSSGVVCNTQLTHDKFWRVSHEEPDNCTAKQTYF